MGEWIYNSSFDTVMDFAVTVDNVFKRYGQVEALQGVSLSVRPGELFGIIGPDGAGKTSLFRILATLLLADEGKATVCGLDMVKDYKAIRQRVGYMPGRFSLYQDLTVEENLSFFATVFHTTIEENYDLVRDIYRQIEPFRKRRAGALSGGMKQKLALSCALIHKPDVLFLDEPTTGVDPVSRKEFWEILRRLKEQGITIIASTPIVDEARQCDRIAFINEGRIHGIDTPDCILKQFADILCPSGLLHEKADNRENYVIEVDGLTKRFGTFTAVDHISFKVRQGEIFGFLGANGAGKTTLLKLIGGLLFPLRGRIEVCDAIPRLRKPSFLSDIFFIPEEICLPDMKMKDYFPLICRFYPKFDEELLFHAMEIFEVSESDKMGQMSYGQRKKALISLGIACNTRLLMMDEPTNGLDIPSKSQFRRLIASVASEERCVVISTHQVRDLENLIDALVIIEKSRILVNTTVEQITDHFVFRQLREGETALFAEESLRGRWGMVPNLQQEDSKLDMELFFNAVLEHPAEIEKVLK